MVNALPHRFWRWDMHTYIQRHDGIIQTHKMTTHTHMHLLTRVMQRQVCIRVLAWVRWLHVRITLFALVFTFHLTLGTKELAGCYGGSDLRTVNWLETGGGVGSSRPHPQLPPVPPPFRRARLTHNVRVRSKEAIGSEVTWGVTGKRMWWWRRKLWECGDWEEVVEEETWL